MKFGREAYCCIDGYCGYLLNLPHGRSARPILYHNNTGDKEPVTFDEDFICTSIYISFDDEEPAFHEDVFGKSYEKLWYGVLPYSVSIIASRADQLPFSDACTER